VNSDSLVLECDHAAALKRIDNSRQIPKQQRDLEFRPSLGATPE